MADITELSRRVQTLELTPDQLGNGAKELLDEVATGKITGEEERYSRIDLLDFAANVQGAKAAYDALRPAVQRRDAALAQQLDTRFRTVQQRLAGYRTGPDQYVTYDILTPEQMRQLAADVDALGEPLSQLTATVVRS